MSKKLLNFLGLFTSVSTLFCCALPALFVALGLGASFVTLLNVFPGLIWLSSLKIPIFIFGGSMLLLNGALIKYSKNQACVIEVPVARNLSFTGNRREDIEGKAKLFDGSGATVGTCIATKQTSRIIYSGSVLLYLIGGYFAFIAPLFFDNNF